MNRRDVLITAVSAFATASGRAQGIARSPARDVLVRAGEAALRGGDADAAEKLFEQASGLAHAADAELGLARTHMQRGDYGRALAMVAHTANGHADETAGAILYAWLLFIGGQHSLAEQLIDSALARSAGDGQLLQLRAQTRLVDPRPRSALLDPPLRLAPYGSYSGLPRSARVVASGTLVDGGHRVLATLDGVRRRRRLWVRDGLGRLAEAEVERRLHSVGIAVLRLDRKLSPGFDLFAALKPAFPGSVVHVSRHALSTDATPSWPLLVSGFIGRPRNETERELGMVAAGHAGGPAFDVYGRWIGVSVEAPLGESPYLMQAAALEKALDGPLWRGTQAAAANPKPRVGSEAIYEIALQATIQVLA